MDCRPGCAACCIAPSISSALPGRPEGKPAGLRCPHLLADLRCGIWGGADYPEVCRRFKPDPAVCGSGREEALALLESWEKATRPSLALDPLAQVSQAPPRSLPPDPIAGSDV
jgi:uncharacterized protein